MATLCRLDVFLLFTFLNIISNSRLKVWHLEYIGNARSKTVCLRIKVEIHKRWKKKPGNVITLAISHKLVTHLKSKKMRESDHLILFTCGKIWAKATHIWLVSMSGDNAANTAKVQDYALCLPTKRMGRPRTSPIMLLPCHEIAEVRRLPPPHI